MRRGARLTQRELAAKAGCSLTWIANAEGGYVPRSSDTLERVLRALAETADALTENESPALASAPSSPKGDGAAPLGRG